ncbi:DedA family protein [Paenibacillus lemnae]|uniref:DedA family protein n=1 Tax=Paenibacillus lemnae TaxID=1330551 RepID=A0A848M9P7_PAELE|nr:DedA family protein [Paenibacillus lemnae]NMO97326.1 DedA family protein [Paenibacillus lemnae]
MDMVKVFISQYGYFAILLLLAFGIIGLPIPDETLMLFVGYLVSIHVLNFILSVLFSFVGSVAGMTISYLIGKNIGFAVIEKYGKWIGLTSKRFEKVRSWTAKYGAWAVFLAYFIPGVRHAAGYVFGITKMRFRKYVLFCCISAAIWSVLFVSIGYYVGEKLS